MGCKIVKDGKQTEFRTQKGYDMTENSEMTTAMEDYLEMICRRAGVDGIHVRDLANDLHVKPSSASKMIGQLKKLEFVTQENYGTIYLTAKGRQVGEYLLFRHRVIHRFLCFLNQSQDELYETERLEHFFSKTTIINLKKMLDKWMDKKE